MRSPFHGATAFLAVALMSSFAIAQQAVHTPTAAQPSTGVLMVRQLVEFTHYENDPTGLDRTVDDTMLLTDLAYGLTKDTVVMLRAPVLFRDTDSPNPGVGGKNEGFGDLHVMVKKRIWQNDTGPIDTARLGLVTGLDLRTGKAPFGSDSFDPMLGVVYTQIKGRHGFNAAARYKFNTGSRPNPVRAGDSSADIVNYELAYLYRLAPESYAADTKGAWYAIAEAHGTYETNGDNELFLAPGVMYEGRNWALEASVSLPAWQDLDHRPEAKFVVTLGLRLLF
ncbi:MAG: hypothetical protein GC162_07945 [Planctomycetes bacterium]|nr:hypothetical protein [Planctomycetota bacterium]